MLSHPVCKVGFNFLRTYEAEGTVRGGGIGRNREQSLDTGSIASLASVQ